MLASLVNLVLILLSTSEGLIISIVSDSFFMSVPDPLHRSWMLISLLEEFSRMYLNCVRDMGILSSIANNGSAGANCSLIESRFFVDTLSFNLSASFGFLLLSFVLFFPICEFSGVE